jgi:hypothetical protein
MPALYQRLIIKPPVYDQFFDARKLAELLGSVSGIRDGVFEHKSGRHRATRVASGHQD